MLGISSTPLHMQNPSSILSISDWFVRMQCDAYEYTGQPMGAYGNGERGVHIAFEARTEGCPCFAWAGIARRQPGAWAAGCDAI